APALPHRPIHSPSRPITITSRSSRSVMAMRPATSLIATLVGVMSSRPGALPSTRHAAFNSGGGLQPTGSSATRSSAPSLATHHSGAALESHAVMDIASDSDASVSLFMRDSEDEMHGRTARD